MEEIIEKLKAVIIQENSQLRQEMKQDMDDLRQEMRQDMDNLRQEMKQDMKDLRKEILDKQFVFENDYGKKIDAIFDYVQFHQKNNLKRFDSISSLEKRVNLAEIQILDHEKRITALERKKV